MRVRALTSVYYAGRDHPAGEEFETETDMHGTLLMAAQSVEPVEEAQNEKPQRGRYARRDLRAVK